MKQQDLASFFPSLNWLTPPLASDLSGIVLLSQGARMGLATPALPSFPSLPIFLVLTSSWSVNLLRQETDLTHWKSSQPFQACTSGGAISALGETLQECLVT